jgi:hypothetical protein
MKRIITTISLALTILFVINGCNESSTSSGSIERIGNKATKVFHTTECYYVDEIKDKAYFDSREEAITQGYRPDESNKCDP